MRAFLVICLLGLSLGLAFHFGRARLPDRWNPWAPLHVADAPSLLTRYKLMRLSNDAPACRAVLAEARMTFTAVPDRTTGEGCGFRNAVRISATSARISQPFVLSCRSAVALALWEQHVVQPAAQRWFGKAVVQLEHFGSYACRNVYGRESGRRSRHATADALDVAGFRLADGRRIRVARDWNAQSPASGFLHEIHDGACPLFSSVLGPDYNAAHHDHFHLDHGGFGLCR